MSKLNKKAKATSSDVAPILTPNKQCLPLYGWYGILALFVFASIAYSTILVCLTYADKRYWIGLAPAVAFALWIAIYKFSSK